MKILHKATLLLLLILCIAPFASFAAEEEGDSHAEVTTVTQHNEVCFSPGTSLFTSDFILSHFMTEVNDSVTLDFEPEVLNVTQNNVSSSLDGFTISWSFVSLDNGTFETASGDHFAYHVDPVTEEVNILWSITISADDSSVIDNVCVDAVFSLHVEHSEEHAEEAISLGNLLVTLIIVISVPSVVLVAFNKLT